MYIITIYLYQTIRVFWSSVLAAPCKPAPASGTWKLANYLRPHLILNSYTRSRQSNPRWMTIYQRYN